MIRIIRSETRHLTEIDWLKSYWHFSFDNYYDPENVSFGSLRVFNEDWIRPDSGFPMHPHRDMEIVTYVIDGELEHRDDQRNHGVIRPGEVQRMTAGTGIVHSEANPSGDTACHLLQIWITPAQKGLQPGWEQRQFTREMRSGKLLPVVSPHGSGLDTLEIHQDATIYISSLKKGESVAHTTGESRKVYLFVISGNIDLNGEKLSTGDQARAEKEREYTIEAEAETELLLIDLQ